jgi:hypothetical protein
MCDFPRDYGDDLTYAAESVMEELKAVSRNLGLASAADKRRAHEVLIEARAYLNDVLTECEP